MTKQGQDETGLSEKVKKNAQPVYICHIMVGFEKVEFMRNVINTCITIMEEVTINYWQKVP